MRKLLSVTVLLILAFALAACGGEIGSNPPAGTAETPAPAEPAPAEPAPAEPAPTETPESAGPAYFGEWTVSEAVGSAEISTGDNSLIGKKASYSAEQASFGDEAMANPTYQEAELTSEQFIAEYRTQLSAIGIEGDSVKTLTIADWMQPGSLLLIKDEQTLITLWDGTFYALKKDS
ncbi:hypothetical protein MO973_46645 [Paenibacillus sp. TRM 82003]|nr:hypothetical protein [Paenibacillus sp. TRM 82003]